jgi:hypothetical protein
MQLEMFSYIRSHHEDKSVVDLGGAKPSLNAVMTPLHYSIEYNLAYRRRS